MSLPPVLLPLVTGTAIKEILLKRAVREAEQGAKETAVSADQRVNKLHTHRPPPPTTNSPQATPADRLPIFLRA